MDLQHALTILIEGKDELSPVLDKINEKTAEFEEAMWAAQEAGNEVAEFKFFDKMEASEAKFYEKIEDAADKASRMWDEPGKAAMAFGNRVSGAFDMIKWAWDNMAIKLLFGKFGKFIEKWKDRVVAALKFVRRAVTTMGMLTAAFLGASLAAAKFAEEGEFAKDVFDSIAGESAPELLQALRESSRFMIEDTRLLQTYNKAFMLVGDTIARRMPEAYESLSRVAAAYGEDADYLMDRLYRSVGRLSTRWMAYIGTVVTVEEATAAATVMFGKSADALSYNEKQAAMMELTLERLADRAQDFPEILGTTVQMSAALQSMLKNIGQTYGEIFTPALRSATQAGLAWLKVIQSLISEGGGLYNFLRTISATMSVLFDFMAEAANKFFEFEDDVNATIDRLGQNLINKAWEAFSWGWNIGAQIGIGLAKAAAKFIAIAAASAPVSTIR